MNDHIWNIKDIIIQPNINVAYDQTHDQQVSHKDIKYLTQAHNQKSSTKSKEAKHSLEAYDLYIFLPLWQQVTKKFKNA